MGFFLKILGYHSINDKNNTYIYNRNITTSDHFEKQMKYLKRNYTIVSLETILNMIKQRRNIGGKYVAITFDDAYADFVQNAYAIIKKYNVPATVFVITDCTSDERIKWEDELTYIRNSLKNEELLIEWFKKNVTDINVDGWADLISELQMTNPSEIDTIVARISGTFRDSHRKRIVMSWEEIRELSKDEDITFGSHTCSHANMTILDDQMRRKELRESKEMIESYISKRITGFCYPYGRYTKRVKEILREEGFEYAITSDRGFNTVYSDVFELKRIMIFDYPTKALKRWLSSPRFIMHCVKSKILRGLPRVNPILS